MSEFLPHFLENFDSNRRKRSSVDQKSAQKVVKSALR
jgi:hypothetical protein